MGILPGLTSPRRLLRAALANRLTLAQTAVADRWVTNRARAYQTADSPAGSIYTLGARADKFGESPRRTKWVADIAIELYFGQAAGGAFPDDALDDLEQEIREAIAIDQTLGLGESEVALFDAYPSDWEVGITRQGERLDGAARLTWTWEYLTTELEGSPTDLVALETVGLDWDLRQGAADIGDPLDASDVVTLEQGP